MVVQRGDEKYPCRYCEKLVAVTESGNIRVHNKATGMRCIDGSGSAPLVDGEIVRPVSRFNP